MNKFILSTLFLIGCGADANYPYDAAIVEDSSGNDANTNDSAPSICSANTENICGTLNILATENITSSGKLSINSGSSLTLDPNSTFTLSKGAIFNSLGGTINLFGKVNFQIVKLDPSVSTYYADSGDIPDGVILADTRTQIQSIYLPPPTSGRYITVKDSGFSAGTNRIQVIASPTFSNNIDDLSFYDIQTNFGFVVVVADGSNWWVIGSK